MRNFILSFVIFSCCVALAAGHYSLFIETGEELTSSLMLGLGLYLSYLGLTTVGAKYRDKFVSMVAKAIRDKENDEIKIFLVSGSGEKEQRYLFPVVVLRKKFSRAELGGLLGNAVPGFRFNVPLLALLINGAIQKVEKGEVDSIDVPCQPDEFVKLKEGAEKQKALALPDENPAQTEKP